MEKKERLVCVRFLWLSCLTSKMDLENIRVNYVPNLFFAVRFVSIDCHHSFNPFIHSGFFRFVQNSILLAAFVVLWFQHIADQWRICKIATSGCWMREGEREQNEAHHIAHKELYIYTPSQNWMKTNTIACFHHVFSIRSSWCYFFVNISLIRYTHSYLYVAIRVCQQWIGLLCSDAISSFILIAMCWVYLFIYFRWG